MNEAENRRNPILIAPCPVGLARQPTPCRRLFFLAFPAPGVSFCRALGIQRLMRTLLAIKGLASPHLSSSLSAPPLGSLQALPEKCPASFWAPW